jgi:hypothetical protein
MDIFISYRSTKDATDRALRQFLGYVQAAVDAPSRYRHPLSKSETQSGISDAVLDLAISRASSRAVTLVALIGGRDDRNSDRLISSQVSKQIGLLTRRWRDRNQQLPWRVFGSRAVKHRYRNFLSIGIGSAFRASVAIKRLILLRAPNGIASTDQTRNRQRSAVSSDISNQLFLEELGCAQGRDRIAIVSSRIAGLAVVTDDQGLKGPGGGADTCGPASPSPCESITWIIPHTPVPPSLSLADLKKATSQTLQASVEELSASIVFDTFNTLPNSHFLALQEGIVDRGKVSARLRLNRFLQDKIFSVTSKTLPKLKKFSRQHARRGGRRASVSRPAADLTLADLYRGEANAGLAGNVPGLRPRWVGSEPLRNAVAELGYAGPEFSACSDDIVNADATSMREPAFGRMGDLFGPCDEDIASSICGLYVTYRCDLAGREPDNIFREVLHVRSGQDGVSFTMSVFDGSADSPETWRLCEGKMKEVDGALFLIEGARGRLRPRRIVCLFVDALEESSRAQICRLSAVVSVVGPAGRRPRTDCILLARVQWEPPDAGDFVRQVTCAAPLNDIIRNDFGDDDRDLEYITGLLGKQAVVENAKERIVSMYHKKGRRQEYPDLDLQPFECGMGNIIERALDNPALSAPFKPGWGERFAATAPPRPAKGRASRRRRDQR